MRNSKRASSVHPARLPSAISLAGIVLRRDVVPMFVEVDLSPFLLAHVDFKLPRRPPPLPAVIGIAQSVIALAKTQRHTAIQHERIPNVTRTQPKQHDAIK